MSITKYKSKEKSETNVFRTADFVLSVFLLYSGVEFVKAESQPDDRNINKKIFIFKRSENFEELLNHYIADDPTVKLRKFISAQKYIKKMIYDS